MENNIFEHKHNNIEIADSLILKNSVIVNDYVKKKLKREQKEKEKICEHYERNIQDNFKLIRFLMANNANKSLIIYQLGFSIEITLKYYLIKKCDYNVKKVSSFKHDNKELLEEIKYKILDKSLLIDFEKLEEKMALIKTDKNKNIEFSDYINYRYNHAEKNNLLLIKCDITDKDKDKIEEVLKCLNIIINH